MAEQEKRKAKRSNVVPNPDYVTVREAAALLCGVSVQVVYRLLASGKLAGRKVGGCRRVERQSIDAYLRPASADPPATPSHQRRAKRLAVPRGEFEFLPPPSP